MHSDRKKLLWVGDAACPSGFARATHGVLATLHEHYDVTVLGMNYRGDPHEHPYPIYAAAPGGDAFGIGRMVWMCDRFKPDVICIQQDGWNLPQYVQMLKQFKEHAGIPIVAVVAVDGINFDGRWLEGIAHAIFWTQFGLKEARKGGYTGPGSVVPLGVDLEAYTPLDRMETRKKHGLEILEDAFVVGNVNRNQPRKRWDLMVRYFAGWIHDRKIRDAYLFLHTAPTGDTGIDVVRLTKYYDVMDRVILVEPPVFYGVSEEDMLDTYNIFDLYASTTQGEGMGLPAMEAMACNIPCLLPDWSGYGDWAAGAASLVPCTSTAIGSPYKNVIGGVVDEAQFIEGMDLLYRDPIVRARTASAGLARVHEARFRWEDIGQNYLKVLGAMWASWNLARAEGSKASQPNPAQEVAEAPRPATEAEWADLGRPNA